MVMKNEARISVPNPEGAKTLANCCIKERQAYQG